MQSALKKGPKPLSVEALHLPLANIDKVAPLGPAFLFSLVSRFLDFNLKKIYLPEELTGQNKIPSYALQEFHNIPNGYYSVYFSKGYSNGFNFFMLNQMGRVRKEMAAEFIGLDSVLDLGCGDGSSTKVLVDEGVKDVWGLDPSPYLLAQAIQRNENAKFVQGVAEATEFADESFNGICSCWMFHEVPSDAADTILQECFRILKPGGKLVIMEPSKHQFRMNYFQLFKNFGLKGLYYRILSAFAHEPFLKEWHDKDINAWLLKYGFELDSNIIRMPEEKIVAYKTSSFLHEKF